MNFLADECLDGRLVAALRQAGHDVIAVGESLPGVTDQVVLRRAVLESRILVTEDTDFGELAVGQGLQACGVILLRGVQKNLPGIARQLLNAIDRLGPTLHCSFVVVTIERIRSRSIA